MWLIHCVDSRVWLVFLFKLSAKYVSNAYQKRQITGAWRRLWCSLTWTVFVSIRGILTFLLIVLGGGVGIDDRHFAVCMKRRSPICVKRRLPMLIGGGGRLTVNLETNDSHLFTRHCRSSILGMGPSELCSPHFLRGNHRVATSVTN